MKNSAYVCTNCGTDLQYYDFVWRTAKNAGGKTNLIKVPRYKCPNCHKIRRELPDFLYPNKQYDAEIIQGVIDGIIDSSTYGFEDYPCENTMKNWKKKK